MEDKEKRAEHFKICGECLRYGPPKHGIFYCEKIKDYVGKYDIVDGLKINGELCFEEAENGK